MLVGKRAKVKMLWRNTNNDDILDIREKILIYEDARKEDKFVIRRTWEVEK